MSSVQHESSATSQYRDMISPALFERLVNRIMKDYDVEHALSEQLMEGALGFLKASGESQIALSPSPLVDIGWHTFILYTRSYAEFCQRVAGRFIHHEPNDNSGSPQQIGGLVRTVDFMVEYRLPFNPLLWAGGTTLGKVGIAHSSRSHQSTAGYEPQCGSCLPASTHLRADCDDGKGSSDPTNDCRNG